MPGIVVVASGETGTPVVSRALATIDSAVPTSKPRVSANNDLFIGALLLELIPAYFMVRHSKIKYRVFLDDLMDQSAGKMSQTTMGVTRSKETIPRHTQMKAYPECNGDRVKTCLNCNGGGVVDKDTDDERQCPTCGGLGFVHDDDDHEEVIKTSRV
ncbi:MAG: hypothetical protein ABWZ17_10635 [Candidatus Binatia bacterium]